MLPIASLQCTECALVKMADLLDAIFLPSLECLNQNDQHPLANALKQGYREDKNLYLESDTDEQLLIHIPFNSAVKLNGITLSNANKPAQGPRKVKLFINRHTIGFSQASDEAAAHEVELSAADLASDKPIPLKLVKFQGVNWLTIFVESNQEDEETTVIEKIVVQGIAGDSFDVGSIKDVSKE
ncbi:PITH domain-containing protein [Helicosporidium sp. ATCC 50920]|nr:PITH domain-containing protein [Helicosporidium sp. ATCC 50920]|eukprot:KDD74602.1 PITH domain-containing protein [Helicosporidium sp. ATCC 50920]